MTRWMAILCITATVLWSIGMIEDHVQVASADNESLRGHVARNIITTGGSILICSEYPTATRAAISLWNAALQSEGYIQSGRTILNLYTPPSGSTWIDGCPETSTTDKIASVIVARATVNETGIRQPCMNKAALGCVKLYRSHLSGSPWYTFKNRLVIAIHERVSVLQNNQKVSALVFPTDADRPVHNHHSLLIYTITHETGHILGIAHTPCTDRSIMFAQAGDANCSLLSLSSVTVRSGIATIQTSGSARITNVDMSAYHEAYHPDPVNRTYPSILPLDTPITVTYISSGFTLTWNASNVHVEDNFVVRRKTGTTWSAPLATVAANGTSATITGTEAVSGTYGVFSTTHADIKYDRHSHPHAALGVVATVNVVIPRPPPVVPPPAPCTVTVVAAEGGTVSGGGTVVCGVGRVSYSSQAKAGWCVSHFRSSSGVAGQAIPFVICPQTGGGSIVPTENTTVTAYFVLRSSLSGGGPSGQAETPSATATPSPSATPAP